ncbi:MAG: sulfur carrier protein ThiS [bacterium]
MTIILNGKQFGIPDNSTIQNLLDIKGIEKAQVVVELNRTIIDRGKTGTAELKPGDEIEVLHFVGGG